MQACPCPATGEGWVPVPGKGHAPGFEAVLELGGLLPRCIRLPYRLSKSWPGAPPQPHTAPWQGPFSRDSVGCWWAQLLSIHLCGHKMGLTQLPSDDILGWEPAFSYLLLWSEGDYDMKLLSIAASCVWSTEQYLQYWWMASRRKKVLDLFWFSFIPPAIQIVFSRILLGILQRRAKLFGNFWTRLLRPQPPLRLLGP